jgi:hypothetical protein
MLLVTTVLITPTILNRVVVLATVANNSINLTRATTSVAVTVDATIKAAFTTSFNRLAVDVLVATMYLATSLTRLTVDVATAVRVCSITLFAPKEAYGV